MRLCRQDDHPQNTKWCPSHRKITCRASKLERKRKISIVIPMVSESSRVHMSAIPLGEMRRCTFCGSRLRAWYLLDYYEQIEVIPPKTNISSPKIDGWKMITFLLMPGHLFWGWIGSFSGWVTGWRCFVLLLGHWNCWWTAVLGQ